MIVTASHVKIETSDGLKSNELMMAAFVGLSNKEQKEMRNSNVFG